MPRSVRRVKNQSRGRGVLMPLLCVVGSRNCRLGQYARMLQGLTDVALDVGCSQYPYAWGQ